MRASWLAGCAMLLGVATAAAAKAPADFGPPGLLYVVGTAHLDTQWRWTVRETIEKYLPATLHDNFALFDKYPHYVFSFEGAFRYQLMREYYPEDYARLKREVAAGRWRVAGSWLDAVDTNMPAPESLIRHALYGNGYFKREFGKTSTDVFLPDCFGFGYALPSIAAHCGIRGFSTQKLSWGSAVGVPFDIGLWEGVDGSRLIAALNPGSYVSELAADLGADSTAQATVAAQGAASGVHVGYKYIGTGDTGGAPTDASIAWLEKSTQGKGPLRVISAASDQLARDLSATLTPAELEALPRYKGELLMTDHGAGCYTSQAEMKRLNRLNERLAGAAEPAAVAAHWLGGQAYPREALREAWTRFLWHQFHDDLTGTSIPEAYLYSWNDEALAANRFAAVLDDAVGAVTQALDREMEGIPLVVYNPLGIEREDLVEAVVPTNSTIQSVLFDPEGRPLQAQVQPASASEWRVIFPARVPAFGFSVYELREGGAGSPYSAHECRAAPDRLENARYRVGIDASGDIVSILDKQAQRELLAAPLRLQLIDDVPTDWPAWEVDYDDLTAAADAVGGPAEVRVVERGPVRATLEITRMARGSRIVQRFSLAAGAAGDRLEIATHIDWASPGTLLKASFPFVTANETATYDLGLGTIERGVNKPALYEVPAQQWADLTAADGSAGAAVLSECRYGWDHPDASTLRLSLVRTPAVNERWQWTRDQGSQDFGHHELRYAVLGHTGDWREGEVAWQADRFNQPLRAWVAPDGKGWLGRRFSLLGVDSRAVAVQAVKLAEDSGEIVVRLQEREGRPQAGVRLTCARPILGARELRGDEEALGELPLADGALRLDFAPYQPRTLAIHLAEPPARVMPPRLRSLALPFNTIAFTPCREASAVDLDGAGRSLPAELMPTRLEDGGILFHTAADRLEAPNAVACAGQELALSGDWPEAVYLLAAALGGDREARFEVDGEPVTLRIQDWAEPIYQWNSRLVGGRLVEKPAAIMPGYLKTDRVAWVGTHRHTTAGGVEAYAFAQLYRYRIALPPGARKLRLPEDPRILVVAATEAATAGEVLRASGADLAPLPETTLQIAATAPEFLDSTQVRLWSPNAGATIRYTLDGRAPSEASPLYVGPITLRATTTVKARAFAEGLESKYIAALEVKQLAWRSGEATGGANAGLACDYFEGSWKTLPDFEALVPARWGAVDAVAIPPFAAAEDYGLRLSGFLKIPADGVYTLHLWSDDGSALSLGGERVIDNDGLHGRGEVARLLALRAGHYPIAIEFFQGPGDAALELAIEGPGLPLQPVPAALFSH